VRRTSGAAFHDEAAQVAKTGRALAAISRASAIQKLSMIRIPSFAFTETVNKSCFDYGKIAGGFRHPRDCVAKPAIEPGAKTF
jgi:hypothetical protein